VRANCPNLGKTIKRQVAETKFVETGSDHVLLIYLFTYLLYLLIYLFTYLFIFIFCGVWSLAQPWMLFMVLSLFPFPVSLYKLLRTSYFVISPTITLYRRVGAKWTASVELEDGSGVRLRRQVRTGGERCTAAEETTASRFLSKITNILRLILLFRLFDRSFTVAWRSLVPWRPPHRKSPTDHPLTNGFEI